MVPCSRTLKMLILFAFLSFSVTPVLLPASVVACGKENATLEKLFFKHFSDFSSVWELHWLHSGWLTGVASSTHCDTREDYTLHHCTGGGKKIGWRAIPQMFTSPTCPQAFRLVTYLSFLFFLFQIQIQIHTNTNTHMQTQLEYWDIDYLHFEFRSTLHFHFHEVQTICRRHGSTINEVASLKGSYV